MTALPKYKPSPDFVLAKATLNAARLLGLNNTELGQVLRVSPATVSRIGSSARTIDPKSAEGDCALTLVKIFRTLDLLVGGDADARLAWMGAYNKALGSSPKDAILTLEGIVYTKNYLNGMKGAV